MFTIFFIISFASRCYFINVFVLISLLFPVSSKILSARIVPPVLPRFFLCSLVLIFLTSLSRTHLVGYQWIIICPLSRVFIYVFVHFSCFFLFSQMSNSILFFLDRGGGDSFYSRSSSLLRHYPLRRNRLPGRKSFHLCLRALRATFLCLQNYSAGPQSTFPKPFQAIISSTQFSFS